MGRLVVITFLFFSSSISTANAATIPGLFNTGVDEIGSVLSPGADDPHYVGLKVILKNGSWVNAPPGSAWIGLSDGTVSDPAGNYSRTFTVDLSDFDLATVILSGQMATDNNGAITVNGVVKFFVATGFAALDDFLITDGFVSGINTIDFFYSNADLAGFNPGGMLIANLSFTGTVVPIPAAVWLFGLALGLLAWVIRGQFT